MHPALSVIFFTTLSGAGLGLLFWLGAIYAMRPLPLSREFALIPFAAGAVLLAAGLLSSLLHLGKPLRAWRALGQWRSSWLSREGVVSLATFVPVLAIAGLLWSARIGPGLTVAAVTLAVLAALAVLCTSRIYDTLKPIAAWHNGWVLPNYLVFAALSGAWWLVVLLSLTGWTASRAHAVLLAVLALAATVLKLCYWRHVDGAPVAATAESLTGLGRVGLVRAFEAPHTETNYLLREMGFVVARRHATVLRAVALVGACLIPLAAAIALPMVSGLPGWLPGVTLLVLHAGLFVERWLFFAQARHTVAAYYRAGR